MARTESVVLVPVVVLVLAVDPLAVVELSDTVDPVAVVVCDELSSR
jgi:hypothetical protein